MKNIKYIIAFIISFISMFSTGLTAENWRTLVIDTEYGVPTRLTISQEACIIFEDGNMVFKNDVMQLAIPIREISAVSGNMFIEDIRVGIDSAIPDATGDEQGVVFVLRKDGVSIISNLESEKYYIRNLEGAIVKTGDLQQETEVSFYDLQSGIYIINVVNTSLKFRKI